MGAAEPSAAWESGAEEAAMSPEGVSFHPGHQPPSRRRASNTAGMTLTQGGFLNRESRTWVVEASIIQFTSRLPWQGCDPGCQERETRVKWYFQENPPSYDGRTYTGGKKKHRAGPHLPYV